MASNNRVSRRNGSSKEPGKSERYKTKYPRKYPGRFGNAKSKRLTIPDIIHDNKVYATCNRLRDDTSETSPSEVVARLMGKESHKNRFWVTLGFVWKVEIPRSTRKSFRGFKVGDALGVLFSGDSAIPIRVRKLPRLSHERFAERRVE